jgi:hypothetical protein
MICLALTWVVSLGAVSPLWAQTSSSQPDAGATAPAPVVVQPLQPAPPAPPLPQVTPTTPVPAPLPVPVPAPLPAPEVSPAPVPVAAEAPVAPEVSTYPPAPVAEVGAPPPVPPEDTVRIAVLLGIISLPRPAEIEVMVKIDRLFSLGVQYSMLPTLTVPGQDASLKLNATQAVVRWFPFRGAFYLGSGIGYQQLNASLGQTVQNGRLVVAADMSTVFLSPQLGWLWMWRSGFALGINLGIQIPLPRDPVVSVAFNGQPVPDDGAGYPPEVATAARNDKDEVTDLARIIMKYPIPNLDLLKIGFVF